MITFQVPIPEKMPAVLLALHAEQGRRDEQTVRGGTTISLQGFPLKSVARVMERIRPMVDEAAGRNWRIGGLWSVALDKGGYHITHNHPKGALSGVVYLQAGQGGELVVDGEEVKPEAGKAVLFPSDKPHYTKPHGSSDKRLTLVFDVVSQ